MSALSFRITRNDISPALSKMANAAKHPKPIYRAMGTTFLSLTMGNFKSAEYRPIPWVAKKDGTPSNLQKEMHLCKDFSLIVSNTGATVKSSTPYAAIHQFGAEGHVAGKKVGTVQFKNRRGVQLQAVMSGGHGIPPRPFFPVADGKLTPAAEEKIAAAGHRAMERQIAS